jgi:hypothetical protein
MKSVSLCIFVAALAIVAQAENLKCLVGSAPSWREIDREYGYVTFSLALNVRND